MNTTADLKNLNRPNVHILQADVTDVKSLKVHFCFSVYVTPLLTLIKVAAEVVAKATDGTLDVLINNAAYIDPTRNTDALHG